MSKSGRAARFEFDAEVVPRVTEWVAEARALFARSKVAEAPAEWALGLEDVIEGITVSYAARLVASLVNEYEAVRLESAGLLVALASLLGPAPLEEAPARAAVDAFRADESGFNDAVHGLMRLAGPPLCRGAFGSALVAALEGYYAHPDLAVQRAAIAASSRVMAEGADAFGAEIHPAGVYALFFLLDVPPPAGALAALDPRRLAVVEGLGLLAPLYAASDGALAGHVLARLLQAPAGGARETAALQRALAAIFGCCAGPGPGRPPGRLGRPPRRPLGAAGGEERLGLLAWAAAELLRAAPPGPPPSPPPPPSTRPPPRRAFPRRAPPRPTPPPAPPGERGAQVLQHCRGPSPALRYGAAALLAALLHAYPPLVDECPDPVFFPLFVGCFDADRSVRRLHLTMLATHAEAKGWRAVYRPVNRYLSAYAGYRDEEEEREAAEEAKGIPLVVSTAEARAL
eukprot:tig00021013_g17060.t1